MQALFLIEYVAFEQLEGVYKDLLQVDVLVSVLLVSHLFERDGFMGERA